MEHRDSIHKNDGGESNNEEDFWKGYDSEALVEAIDRSSNLFTPEEAEKMIEQIYEWRRIGSRPSWRPRKPGSMPTEADE